jgi:hypothetical protein
VPVVLQTPYGIAKSAFMAVDRDHKLDKNGNVVPGRVGHDRIQQASGTQSIGEAIRHWYAMKSGDFERIDVEAAIHPAEHFILIPIGVTFRGSKRSQVIEKIPAPLSFHRDHQSKLWKQQIAERRQSVPDDVAWAGQQITRVVGEHQGASAAYIKEEDLLRASGAVSILGLDLSAYVGKGYDCPKSQFQFAGLPSCACPVEIKKRSGDFDYQVTRYADLPRAVVLCMKHDYVNPPEHVDILELATLAEYLGK